MTLTTVQGGRLRNAALSKLLQESYVTLKKQLNVVDTIFQERQTIHAHTESKSGNLLRVVSVVLHEFEHVGIDHAAAENFDPSSLLAGTARGIIRPALAAAAADEARNIQFRAGLGERKERRPEMRLHARTKQRFHRVIERALEIAKSDVGVDGQ